ncbi:hypothetical protein ACIQPP_50505 [Streptomyces violaceusniger]|uniref:hypothetical protein n=1 Tax=Streptomyces violaceusniger TaxID=68280 RepID=UPI0009C26049|nr:hypothetical protein [Streptomyces hygroscopicus]AQW48313.1 hypothetical protein SHXM_01776 [Streptomyces hygroscopicus]
MNLRRSVVGAAILAAAVVGAVAPAASARTITPAGAFGPCGQTRDVYLSGAEAHWTINCGSGNKVTVNGWVKDTNGPDDNQCAQVYAYFPYSGTTKYSARACGNGQTVNFALSGMGTSADVYLREIG